VTFPSKYQQKQPAQPVALDPKTAGFLGKCPAGNGLLGGGRNSLLKSAQEATQMSVATAGFKRQCNKLGITGQCAECNRKFTI